MAMSGLSKRGSRFTWRGRLPAALVPVVLGPVMILMALLEPDVYGDLSVIGISIGAVVTALGVRALRGGIEISAEGLICRLMLSTKRLTVDEVAGFEVAEFVMPPMWLPSPFRKDFGMLIVLKKGTSIACPYIYGSLESVLRIAEDLRRDLRKIGGKAR